MEGRNSMLPNLSFFFYYLYVVIYFHFEMYKSTNIYIRGQTFPSVHCANQSSVTGLPRTVSEMEIVLLRFCFCFFITLCASFLIFMNVQPPVGSVISYLRTEQCHLIFNINAWWEACGWLENYTLYWDVYIDSCWRWLPLCSEDSWLVQKSSFGK